MIIITAPKDFSFFSTHPPLDLGKNFPGWGVEWDRTEERVKFNNPTLKIPGGKFYASLSEPGLSSLNISMVTTNLDLKFLDKTLDRIGVICTEADGSARPLLISKSYEPGWSRKARLTKLSSSTSTEFNKIDIEFSLIDNLWYGPVKTQVWDGPIDLSTSIREYSLNRAPSDFILDIKGNIKNLKLVTSTINSKPLVYTKYDINGSYKVETENNIMWIDGISHLSDLPPNFRLNKALKISGGGKADKITLTYRETKI